MRIFRKNKEKGTSRVALTKARKKKEKGKKAWSGELDIEDGQEKKKIKKGGGKTESGNGG